MKIKSPLLVLSFISTAALAAPSGDYKYSPYYNPNVKSYDPYYNPNVPDSYYKYDHEKKYKPENYDKKKGDHGKYKRSIRKEYLDGITILWYCYHNVMGLELQIRKALELELFQRAANLEK
ncbi:4317_t:CDS:2 [Funneliformis geosporum]|uniref:4317_t:CDS:1 n=1 Tax=Funneliformis geosporum TaxID=1117311 RepID=A0A9W4SXE9_9GLOM|nr:4317_t:CDS:2 [Funneliformis geosporum]